MKSHKVPPLAYSNDNTVYFFNSWRSYTPITFSCGPIFVKILASRFSLRITPYPAALLTIFKAQSILVSRLLASTTYPNEPFPKYFLGAYSSWISSGKLSLKVD